MHPGPPPPEYPDFVMRYFAHLATSPLASFHRQAAQQVAADPAYHGLWMWFRGAAKSTHATVLLPLWLHLQQPSQVGFLLVVGQSLGQAQRTLAQLRTEILWNEPLTQTYGLAPVRGQARADFFMLNSGLACMALGLGQSPRGLRVGAQRPDFIVADDLDHAALSHNPARVRAASQWLLEDLLGTQDTGRHRFIMAGNRFSRHSLVNTLAETGRFTVHRVDALTPQGIPTWPEKYGLHGQWLTDRRQLIGHRAFMREYMNTPLEEGGLFSPDWLRWQPRLPWAAYDDLICYLDPSYSHSPRADYKAAKLWGRTGMHYHHLAAFVRQAPWPEVVRWCHALQQQVAAEPPPPGLPPAQVLFFIEANVGQDELLHNFYVYGQAQGQPLSLRTDRRAKPPKLARLEALIPLYEGGWIAYAQHLRTDPDTQTGLDQLLALEPGSRAHDDGPDADEGALWLLQHRAHAQAPLVGLRTPLGARLAGGR